MPIPFILGAIALGSAVFGGVKTAEGIGNMNQAKEIGERAQQIHETAVRQINTDWEVTNELAAEYGQLQIDVITNTIGRFIDFIERIGQRNKQSEREFLEGLDGVTPEQVKRTS